MMQASMTSIGKMRRMERIFRRDGRALMFAVNHGLGFGPVDGICDLGALFARTMPQTPDSITIHKGIALRFAHQLPPETALILKMTNATRFFTPEETGVAEVEEAVRLGADAIAVGLSLCGPLEREEIARAARMVEAAERCGMPTVAHSYPCGSYLKDEERYQLKNVAYATRVALELGIDIIKTYWTGSEESFAQIVKYGSPAKVVISGGPRCETLRACFEMTYQGMAAGAAGVTYGRNIWQHPCPEAVMAGLKAIIHGGADVNAAMEAASEVAHCELV